MFKQNIYYWHSNLCPSDLHSWEWKNAIKNTLFFGVDSVVPHYCLSKSESLCRAFVVVLQICTKLPVEEKCDEYSGFPWEVWSAECWKSSVRGSWLYPLLPWIELLNLWPCGQWAGWEPVPSVPAAAGTPPVGRAPWGRLAPDTGGLWDQSCPLVERHFNAWTWLETWSIWTFESAI